MNKVNKYGYYQSPIDLIEITSNGEQIIKLELVKHKNYQESSHHIIKQCAKQLDDYFKKKLKEFNLPILIAGTPFQELVWSHTWKIPYGTTISYKQLAQKINNPKAVRAVGTALRKNPLPIIIPCHRIIGSNKNLLNYYYGADKKKYLFQLEEVSLIR